MLDCSLFSDLKVIYFRSGSIGLALILAKWPQGILNHDNNKKNSVNFTPSLISKYSQGKGPGISISATIEYIICFLLFCILFVTNLLTTHFLSYKKWHCVIYIFYPTICALYVKKRPFQFRQKCPELLLRFANKM